MTRLLEIQYRVVDAELALTPKILAREIWDGLVAFARRYNIHAEPYIAELLKTGFSSGAWIAEPEKISFAFPVHASQEDLYWAMRLGLSFHRGTLDKLASQLGIEILNDENRKGELELSKQALNGTFLLKALMPDTEQESEFVLQTLGPDIHQSQSASDYILASLSPSLEGLAAVASASQQLGWYRCARGLFEVGGRFRADLGPQELESLVADASQQAFDSSQAEAAWIAFRAGLGIELNEVSGYMDKPAPIPDSLVEFVGYGSWSLAQAEGLVAVFRTGLSLRSELDEAIASSTYNMFRDKDSLWEARSVLRKLEESGLGDSAQIAARALEFFERN